MPFAPARGRKGTCGHNGLAATGDAILDLFDLPEITSEAEALEAVRGWGPMLQFVPERLKPPEVCLEAVKSLGTALKFVPKDMKGNDLCLLAVQNDARLVTLLRIRSGYSPAELLEADDPYGDKALHRAFADRRTALLC